MCVCLCMFENGMQKRLSSVPGLDFFLTVFILCFYAQRGGRKKALEELIQR